MFWFLHSLPILLLEFTNPSFSHPIYKNDAPTSEYLEVLMASIFSTLAIIFLVLMCASCLRKNKGHEPLQEDGTLDLQAVTTLQPSASSVFTIEEEVMFEPLPDIKRFRNKESRNISCQLPLAAVPLVEVDKLTDWLNHPSSTCQRQKLQYLKVLGGGWFGQAVEAEGRNLMEDEHQSRCVVKILRPDATNLEFLRFLEEVRCYRDLNHSNILNLVGVCLESYPKLVVLQYCSKGDLKSYLLDQQKIGYIPTVSALMKMSLDVSNGIYAIHNKGMIHPDFAARNCLVTSKGTVVIGDYGISKELHKADYYEIGGAVLPVRWVAPEDVFVSELRHDTVVAEYKASEKGNIWSLGVIFWEIFELGNQPFQTYSDEVVIENVIISQKIILARPKRQPSGDALYQLMLQCFSAQPDGRPPVENVIATLSGLLAIAMRSDVDFDTRWDRLQRQYSAFSDSASADETLFGMPDFEESLKAQHSKARVASDDDLAYAEKVNEALRTLDRALNGEEEEAKPKFDLGLAVLSNPFGPTNLETQQLDSLTPSYLEVEERAERGEFENLVREKSRSVTDLMRLTHVENGSESLSFSDKEPLLDKEFPDKISPLKFIVNTSDTVLNSSYFESPVRDNFLTSTPQGSYNDISDQKDFSSINLSILRQDMDIPDLLEVSPERRSEALDLISNAPELSFKVEDDVGCEDSCEQVLPSGKMQGSSHVIEINYNAGKPLLTPILEESQSLSSESSLKEAGYNQNIAAKEVGKDFTTDSLKKVSLLPKIYSGMESSKNLNYIELNSQPHLSSRLRDDMISNYTVEPITERQSSISLSQQYTDGNTIVSGPEFSSNVAADNFHTEDVALIPESFSKDVPTTSSLPQSLDSGDSDSFENAQLISNDISTVSKSTWTALMSNKKNVNDILSTVSTAKDLCEIKFVPDTVPSKAKEDNQDHNVQIQASVFGELEYEGGEAFNSKERPCSPESSEDITESKDWTSDVSSTDDECETAGDGSISTGGIFIWKEPQKNENEEGISEEEELEEQKEQDPQLFIPSTWNSSRTPTKSALKSPEHTLENSDSKKSVSFRRLNRQKIYSYPPVDTNCKTLEIIGDSGPESPRRHWIQLQNKEEQLRQLAQLADWEYDEEGNERSSPDYEFTVVGGEAPTRRKEMHHRFSDIYSLSNLDQVDQGGEDEFYPSEPSASNIAGVGSTFNPKDFFPKWAKTPNLRKSFEIDLHNTNKNFCDNIGSEYNGNRATETDISDEVTRETSLPTRLETNKESRGDSIDGVLKETPLQSEPFENFQTNQLVLKDPAINCYKNDVTDKTVNLRRIEHFQDGDTGTVSIEKTPMYIEGTLYAEGVIDGNPIKIETKSFEDDQPGSVVNNTSLINACNYVSSDSSSKSIDTFDQNSSNFFKDNDSYLAIENTSLSNTSFSKRESEQFSKGSDGAVIRNSETPNNPETELLPYFENSTKSDCAVEISEEKEYLKHLKINSTSDFVTDSDDSVDVTKFLS